MTTLTEQVRTARSHPHLPYVLPFAFFLVLLQFGPGLERVVGIWEYPVRVALLTVVLLVFSRHVIDLRVRFPLTSVFIGVAVFAIWVGPDLLFPGYRNHWLFQNSITGSIASSIQSEHRSDPIVLLFRSIRAVIIVPIIEELFWRAWLMRWIISNDVEKVPLGSWTWSSMIITAVLFASEHGAYWEVGLIAGLIYNWLMVRTKSLGDCILAHAITNGVLSAFVVATGRWEYWL